MKDGSFFDEELLISHAHNMRGLDGIKSVKELK